MTVLMIPSTKSLLVNPTENTMKLPSENQTTTNPVHCGISFQTKQELAYRTPYKTVRMPPNITETQSVTHVEPTSSPQPQNTRSVGELNADIWFLVLKEVSHITSPVFMLFLL